MFTRLWLLWLLIGLAVAAWIFWWAVRRGQFEEGRRAALLPLDDVELQIFTKRETGNAELAGASRGRLNLVVMLTLVVVGATLSLLTFILSLGHV
jgi:nitrogen fixation-related uncharacterized protein